MSARLLKAPLLVVFALLSSRAAAQEPLRVLEIRPGPEVTPGDVLTITFDRPVVVSLENAFDPARHVRLQPGVRARIDWRDPSTVRIAPTEPLAPGAYTLAIDTGFAAIGGERLAEPQEYHIAVRGPRRLASVPWLRPDIASSFDPTGTLRILFTAPPDSALLERTVFYDLRGVGYCAPRRIPFRFTGRRQPVDGDPWELRGMPYGEPVERFQQIVELRPQSALPENCEGELVVPSLDSLDAPAIRYSVNTARTFVMSHACLPVGCLASPNLFLHFSAPVRGEDLSRHIQFEPAGAFQPSWSNVTGTSWRIPIRFAPRTTHRIVVDTVLQDIYGRSLNGPGKITITTGDELPGLGHFVGLQTLSRGAPPSLRVRHVNVDSVELLIHPVSDEARALITPLVALRPVLWTSVDTIRRVVGLTGAPNETRVTEIPLPELAGRFRNQLIGVQVRGRRVMGRPADSGTTVPMVSVVVEGRNALPTSLAFLQYTNLMAHAVVGEREGAVFVTDVRSGAPVPNATVRLLDTLGGEWARGGTDATGVAILEPLQPAPPLPAESDQPGSQYYFYSASWQPSEARLLEVSTPRDRVVLPLLSAYAHRYGLPAEDELAPSYAYRALSTRALVFTDRDIYRPGEWVHAAVVLRDGPLDRLQAPEQRTRVRWRSTVFSRQDNRWTTVHEAESWLSDFGAGADSFRIAPSAQLGAHRIEIAIERDGKWRNVSSASYSVAEYRAPEFLLRLTADSVARFLGDTGRARLSARFLFDAPMGHAPVQWSASLQELEPWDLDIANLPRGFQVGDAGDWWGRDPRATPHHDGGTDTLDAGGILELRVPTEGSSLSRGARVHYHVAVADVNRQTVTATATQVMHGSSYYLAIRDAGSAWWWTAGARQRLELLAVRPDGRRVSGVRVRAALVRLQWEREFADGQPSGRWAWTRDTVHIDSLVTADSAVSLEVTASDPGFHTVVVMAQDEQQRPLRSSVAKYVMGRGGARWGESPAQLGVLLSSDRVRSGDTVFVGFDVPFTAAEAWITVERERMLWQRRLRLRAGPASVPIPVPDAFVPDATVSVLLVNRTDATRLDSLHHRMRLGSTGLEVDDAPRRLAVSVRSEQPEYAPADSAAVLIDIRDARGRGVPATVAVWAVDEGVLSLTGYQRPDPVQALYQHGGISLLRASTLTSVRPGIPRVFLRRMIGFDIYGRPDANRLSEVVVTGIGGEMESRRLAFTVGKIAGNAAMAVAVASPALRQDFRTTAFFRAFVTTDDSGRARVALKLPDNITTFRVIALAASGGDRFGSGDSSLIATKPLMIRAAMPRFVRPGDELLAGGVANARDARPRPIEISATADGLELRGDSTLQLTLASSGTEARFRWRVPVIDSARVRLALSDGVLSDAVSVPLPVRPDYSPRAHTLSGVVRATETVAFVLPPEIDAARSRLTMRIGSSPMPMIHVAGWYLRAYPYMCTEQLTSVGRWLVSALTLQSLGASDFRDVAGLRRELQFMVDLLQRRQSPKGGFGYWSSESWTSYWLSAHVGLLLLDARALGASVEPRTLESLAASLIKDLQPVGGLRDNPYGTRAERWRSAAVVLADRLAAAHFLQRLGRSDGADEAMRLLPASDRMWWEDRVWLAHLLHQIDRPAEARSLLSRAWQGVGAAGGRIELADSLLGTGLFTSRIRPAARLLSATLAIEPTHPGLGALVERLVQRSRAQSRWQWNTQDHASAAVALAEFTASNRGRAAVVQIRSGISRAAAAPLAELRTTGGAVQDTTIALSGLVRTRGDSVLLPLVLTATEDPVYYALTVDEVPLSRPLRPDSRGISVERWYERFDDARTVTELREGELVRVRLRVTVSGDREFVAITDPLPAGLEAVDLSLRTSGTLSPFRSPESDSARARGDREAQGRPLFGGWYGGWWSPWEHVEKRDDRVLYFARILWKGTYTASYVARATTSGRFVRPPAYGEEMYNPALNGRSEGGWFGVTVRR